MVAISRASVLPSSLRGDHAARRTCLAQWTVPVCRVRVAQSFACWSPVSRKQVGRLAAQIRLCWIFRTLGFFADYALPDFPYLLVLLPPLPSSYIQHDDPNVLILADAGAVRGYPSVLQISGLCCLNGPGRGTSPMLRPGGYMANSKKFPGALPSCPRPCIVLHPIGNTEGTHNWKWTYHDFF